MKGLDYFSKFLIDKLGTSAVKQDQIHKFSVRYIFGLSAVVNYNAIRTLNSN